MYRTDRSRLYFLNAGFFGIQFLVDDALQDILLGEDTHWHLIFSNNHTPYIPLTCFGSFSKYFSLARVRISLEH